MSARQHPSLGLHAVSSAPEKGLVTVWKGRNHWVHIYHRPLPPSGNVSGPSPPLWNSGLALLSRHGASFPVVLGRNETAII